MSDISYVFTPCGAMFNTGPTQAQINAGYPVGDPLSGTVTVMSGIQQWIIPQDGIYTIEARGAQGGYGYNYRNRGGYGSILRGTFALKAGDILKILVGQMGGSHTHDGGGGGGTFVVKVDPSGAYTFTPTGEKITPLLAAGGGGGGSNTASAGWGNDASLGLDGTNGTSPSDGVPGVNGRGGKCASNGYASAGGGFLTDGYGNCAYYPSYSTYHGKSFLNGGAGGGSYAGLATGGFGCGGGTHGNGWGGGGGGGWSGGSTSQSSQYGGGGGGSYNAGLNKSYNIGNCGDGTVIITPASNMSKSEETYVFTSCGASGRLGPDQTQVSATYKFGNPLSGKVSSNNGMQIWTVPKSGMYSIEVRGAQGGNNSNGPGRGAVMKGLFNLDAGNTLTMIVGQQGNFTWASTKDCGGGGGTFVTKGNNPLTSEPLIIAGGGGGSSYGSPGKPGLKSTNGGQGDAPAYATGGVNGNGGGYSAGYGGGGFFTNGHTGTWNGTYNGTQGYAFRNGGNGGNTISNECAIGGFGGGAGGHGNDHIGSGGGGGWSGGGGGGNAGDWSGGGGGSLNTGTEVYAFSGMNSGDGLIIISLIQSSRYFLEQDDRLYTPSINYYDVFSDSFISFPKSELNLWLDTPDFFSRSNTPNSLFAPFAISNPDGSTRTIKPLDYFDLKKVKIFAISLNTINSNKLRVNYKVNKETLINKCQIQLKDDIVITNKIYNKHFAITSTNSIMTMIKKYEKYYNKNWGVDSLLNILNTGIPTDDIVDYNIESDVINLSIAFTDNIYTAVNKLSQIKLVAKTGNNYRMLKSNELDVKSNDDYIFITFKNAHTELVVNKLHKKQDRTILVNTLSEF